jgi:hypothetical protein
MGKKNDFEASGSGSKKVPLPVTVGRLMHGKWVPCDAWSGVQLPGGWRLSCRRVPIPPVPAREPERTKEIRRRRRYLPADLRADPAYAIDSESWRTYLSTETDSRRRAGFMGDRDYPFGPAPPARRQQAPTRREQPQHNDREDEDDDDEAYAVYDDDDDYIEALAYHSEEVKDDSEDYVGLVFHEWQQAMAEGRNFEFPDNMTDDEMAKLGLLVSEYDAPVQPPLPRYATAVMPPGLSADEALRQALLDSAAPPPPPPQPWAPPPLPPQPYGWAPHPPPQPQPWAPPPPPQPQPPQPRAPRSRPAYAPPDGNWPWDIPEVIVLDSDEEQHGHDSDQ